MSEKISLLPDPRGAVPEGSGQGPQSYQSFDNPGLNLGETYPQQPAARATDVRETELIEDGSPAQTHKVVRTAPAPASEGATGRADVAVDVTRADDGDNADTVSRAEEDEPLGADEILFRLRLANFYGSTDWQRHIRRLDSQSKEEVCMQILNTLREQPIDIRQKRELSRFLRDGLDAVSVSSLSSHREGAKKKAHRSNRALTLTSGLLNGSIGRISAYFGSHVASYFVFLRFLVCLDLLMAFLMFGLVTLPQILSGDDAAPKELSGDFGVLSTSVMFYGGYSETKWGYYDRPLAFFLTWASVNVVCFVLITASMYVKYRTSKQAETSREEFPFSTRVFSSWDHTLTTREGASLWQQNVITNTKEMIREERSQETSDLLYTLRLFLIRALINLLVLGILAGSGYLIFIVAKNPDTNLGLPGPLEDLLKTYRLPLLVSALKVLVPPIFDQIIRLERWHPRTEIKINIARIALFYLASLVIFLLSMYNESTQCIRDSNTNTNTSTFCCWENKVGEGVFKVVLIDLGAILLATLFFDVFRAVLVKCCQDNETACTPYCSGDKSCFSDYKILPWNTTLKRDRTSTPEDSRDSSQEDNRDSTPRDEGKKKSKLNFSEFSVASEVLDVIYGQSLVWLGLFFSPLLAAVGFVKLVIVFYFRYVTARFCKVPPQRVFRASRSGNFFLFMLLVNLFVCLFTMTYAVIELKPSTDCGPFKLEKGVYNVITDRVGDLPAWLKDIMFYVSTPAVVVPFVLFLLLGVLYFKAKTSSYQRVISGLRMQLRFERRVATREVFARACFVQGQARARQRKTQTISSQADTASIVMEL